MRLTIACPEHLMADGNQLAMVLGFSEHDARTYNRINYVDEAGNKYAVASGLVSDEFTGKAFKSLIRPAWDRDNKVNMTGAGRAQAKIKLLRPETDKVLKADPTLIVAFPGDNPREALMALGLFPYTAPVETGV